MTTKTTWQHLFFWLVAALVILAFWTASSRIQKVERQLSFSEFMEQLDHGHIAMVSIRGTGAGSEIVGTYKNGQAIRTFAPPQTENLVTVMLDKGVEVHARDANSSSWLSHLVSWTPIIIMIAFLIFFMRQMQSAGENSQPSRAEQRLEAKAAFLKALSESSRPLSEAELFASLGGGAVQTTELRKAVYEMLRDGVVVLTEQKKYRLQMTSGASTT